jgi:hypothetical protein
LDTADIPFFFLCDESDDPGGPIRHCCPCPTPPTPSAAAAAAASSCCPIVPGIGDDGDDAGDHTTPNGSGSNPAFRSTWHSYIGSQAFSFHNRLRVALDTADIPFFFFI